MVYTQSQYSKIMQKIIAKVRFEVETAYDNDEMDYVIEKYGVSLDDDFPVYPKTHKILVLGALAGKINDYKITAKKLGINPEQIEFVNDYSELKHFNTAKLEYSNEYSDIIYGPNPHKQVGMGDTSSLLALLKKEPNKYPKVIEAVANSSLKLSINSFREALLKTRLIECC